MVPERTSFLGWGILCLVRLESTFPPRPLIPTLWVLVLALAACGGSPTGGIGVQNTPPIAPASWRGTVSFDTRSPTPTGASREVGRLLARGVTVRLLDEEGEALATSRTNDEGEFVLEATTAAKTLSVVAHIEHGGRDLMVTTDGPGLVAHEVQVPLGPQDSPHELHVGDGLAMAGALHILHAMDRGWRRVKEWTDRELPPFFCYWDRGVTTNWSFYSGESPAGSGRYTIELLGGEPGRQNSTDTDEHDEGIILHEFGHFVMDVLSSDSSHGGSHPRGYLLNPGLAWEEGRATWFAATVLQRPLYQDTIGIEPSGELRVHHDIERGSLREPKGMGSEAGVTEVLWDLSDGVEGQPDIDADGVAMGPAGVLRAMMELGEEPGAHPTIATFLRFLVRTGKVPAAQVQDVLTLGRHPGTMLPPDDTSTWPIDVPATGSVAGKVDGLTNPAPSGGGARPTNGFDATNAYRVHLEEPGRLWADLRIFGSGRGADHQDLDLELRDIRSTLIAASNGEGPTESVSRQLEAGWYLIYVRDGGQGNKASFELTTRVTR